MSVRLSWFLSSFKNSTLNICVSYYNWNVSRTLCEVETRRKHYTACIDIQCESKK